MNKRLFLIDGHALIFKMYYAFLKRPMINSKGADMSILFGFTKYILELIEKEKPTHLAYFFGPNQYKVLRSYDKGVDSDRQLDMDKMLPLGWGIFGWVNKYLIIPIFNFLGTFIGNYGVIILLLTVIIKLILLPLSVTRRYTFRFPTI